MSFNRTCHRCFLRLYYLESLESSAAAGWRFFFDSRRRRQRGPRWPSRPSTSSTSRARSSSGLSTSQVSFSNAFWDSFWIETYWHFSRNYRGDVDNSVIEKFIGLVNEREEEGRYVKIFCLIQGNSRFQSPKLFKSFLPTVYIGQIFTLYLALNEWWALYYYTSL